MTAGSCEAGGERHGRAREPGAEEMFVNGSLGFRLEHPPAIGQKFVETPCHDVLHNIEIYACVFVNGDVSEPIPLKMHSPVESTCMRNTVGAACRSIRSTSL